MRQKFFLVLGRTQKFYTCSTIYWVCWKDFAFNFRSLTWLRKFLSRENFLNYGIVVVHDRRHQMEWRQTDHWVLGGAVTTATLRAGANITLAAKPASAHREAWSPPVAARLNFPTTTSSDTTQSSRKRSKKEHSDHDPCTSRAVHASPLTFSPTPPF